MSIKVKCIDDCNKEKFITKGKEYMVKSIGTDKYIIIDNRNKTSCIDKRRFNIISKL